MKPKNPAALEVVKLVCRVLDDKKASAINILDVGQQSSITDYLVLATATSEPHLRALRIEVEKVLDAQRVHLVGMEAAQESGWVVIDAFDVMIHLFLPEVRDRYGLERLWRDATELTVAKILQVSAEKRRPNRRPAPARPKKPAKKSAKKRR
ncbi:MAG: ribosome silencing factor [Opitutaceae bacterium]|nr:ribosome silencing factor [Opitutaceae bacterium]